MIPPAQYLTAEQLAALPDDGCHYELVDGAIQMMSPAGGWHGRIAGKLLIRIGSHVEQHKLGVTFAAETGFLIQRDPDTVRAPDVSFVSSARLGGLAYHPGYLPLAPDLVAEVVSPHDSTQQMADKADDWLRAGVRVVLIVDPQSATVIERRSAGNACAYEDGQIDLNDVLPGFLLDVNELFI